MPLLFNPNIKIIDAGIEEYQFLIEHETNQQTIERYHFEIEQLKQFS